VWADSGYDGKPLAAWARKIAAITVEVVQRTAPHSFQVFRRRWVIERTFGWLMPSRRLVRGAPSPVCRARYGRATRNGRAGNNRWKEGR
jgi:transposase